MHSHESHYNLSFFLHWLLKKINLLRLIFFIFINRVLLLLLIIVLLLLLILDDRCSSGGDVRGAEGAAVFPSQHCQVQSIPQHWLLWILLSAIPRYVNDAFMCVRVFVRRRVRYFPSLHCQVHLISHQWLLWILLPVARVFEMGIMYFLNVLCLMFEAVRVRSKYVFFAMYILFVLCL